MKKYTIKPLKWIDYGKYSIALGLGTTYMVQIEGDMWTMHILAKGESIKCDSLDHGKQLAEQHRLERLLPELEEVPDVP